MNITEVRVHPVDQEKLKAYVSIVFDDCFLISDIKIISGPTGLFISMPSKRMKTGEFKDVAHPLNSETRRWISDKIMAEYERALKERPPAPAAPAAPPAPPPPAEPSEPPPEPSEPPTSE